jgi:hypothetical protein
LNRLGDGLLNTAIRVCSENNYRFFFSQQTPLLRRWLNLRWWNVDPNNPPSWENLESTTFIYTLLTKDNFKKPQEMPICFFIFFFLLWVTLFILFLFVTIMNPSFTALEDNNFQSSYMGLNNMESSFYAAETIDDFWAWAENNLAPTLFFNPEGSEFFIPRYNVLFGPVNFRQYRLNAKPCEVPGWSPIPECYGQYQLSDVNTSSIEIGSTVYPYQVETDHRFTTSPGSSGLGHFYPVEGGIIYTISAQNQTGFVSQVQYLQNSNFVTDATEVIMVEFSIYNPNLNKIAFNTFIFELPASGIGLPSINLSIFALYPFKDNLPIVIVYLIVLVFYFIAIAIGARRRMRHPKSRAIYLREIWTYFDIVHFIVFLFTLSWHVTSLGYLQDFEYDMSTNQLRPNCENCFTIQELALMRSFENTLFGMLFIIYTFGLLQYMRIFEFFGILFKVFQTMIYDVGVFLGLYSVITVAFAGALCFLLASRLSGFTSLTWSIVSLIKIAFGDGQFENVQGINERWGLVIIIFYSLLAAIVLVNLLIAMMSHSYDDVTSEATSEHLIELYTMQKSLYALRNPDELHKPLAKHHPLILKLFSSFKSPNTNEAPTSP